MASFYETKADGNDYMFMHMFSSTSIGAHFHKALEIVYCVEGTMECFISGEKFLLQANEMYVVPSYAVHYNRYKNSNTILSFVFAHNYFHDFEKTYPNMMFEPVLRNQEENKKLYNTLKEMHDTYWAHDQQIPFIKRQSLINDFLYELSLIYPLVPIQEKKLDSTILDILSFINKNYNEDISLDLLARKYNYCPQYFSELFNKNVGCKLTTYLNNIRIENALLEIENPKNKKSLAQIAFDNGFKSLPTFYRTLREKRNG